MSAPTYTPLQLIPPLPPSPYDPAPYPTVLCFDPYADLLHVGSSAGLVSDFCSPLALSRHATYAAHGSKGFGTYSTMRIGYGVGQVKDLQVTDKEVWSLTEGGLAGARRGGLVKWTVSDPLHALRTFDANPINSHEIIAGGTGSQITIVNTSQGRIVKRLDHSHSLSHLKALPRSILSASPSGLLQILDPRQGYRQTSTLATPSVHSGGLTGVDVDGDTVAAWGWDVIQGQPVPSSTLALYDLRTCRPLPSIEFADGISFAKLHPSDLNCVILASSGGHIETVDLVDTSNTSPSTGCQVQLESYVTAMSISPHGDYLALGDSDGQVHLMTSHDLSEESEFIGSDGSLTLPTMNGFEGGVSVDWPDVPGNPPDIQWKERTPLNVIGLPFYDDPLLSNFSLAGYATSSSPLFNSSPAVPVNVLSNMRIIDGVGYAPLPRELKGKRNVVCKQSTANFMNSINGEEHRSVATGARGRTSHRRESGPKFRSEKNRHGEQELFEEEGLGPSAALLEGSPVLPKYYRKVEIKYSKFGVEDFDFEFYNKTRHSGLETHIANSYTNSLLQAYHYTLPIRACAKAHIAQDCPKEHCMLCEAGFLFRMLEDAKGINCQASNFSRAFSATQQASALGLFVQDDESPRKDYAALIQKFNRWLTHTVSAEDAFQPTGIILDRDVLEAANTASDLPPSHIDQVLELSGSTQITCGACGKSFWKPFSAHVVDLIYPRKSANSTSASEGSFASILRSSLLRETSTKAICQFCAKPTTLNGKRRYGRRQYGHSTASVLPPVITVNSSIISDEHLEYWREHPANKSRYGRRRFLPEGVRIRAGLNGDISVVENTHSDPIQDGDVEYVVRAVVASVQEDENAEAHLVAFVNVPVEDSHRNAMTSENWLLFNDFLVRQVGKEEALSCAPSWKMPAIVILERVDNQQRLAFQSLPQSLDPVILLKDLVVSTRRHRNPTKHTCLKRTEIPQPGTLIAIDAEFVALQLEELEIRSDGTKNVLRPTKMSLARVSVLRGDGIEEGRPFIDDYIHTREPVVDYLTEYSGIKEGDLDAGRSTHTLVPLKAAYKKLRILVDLGCVFIGHGLPKDFRTINIFVPPAQVIDTVAIFYDPARHRKLSLRFLSWFLLKQEIQTAEHDSIEDARCALQLYKKYRTFLEENRFEDVMEDIFDAGQRLGFKPPQTLERAPGTNMPPSTPEHRDVSLPRTNEHTSPLQQPWGRAMSPMSHTPRKWTR